MDWFRWWHGTVTDPKFQWVSRRCGQPLANVVAVWACLLECASTATQGNADATRGNVASFDCNVIDVLLGLDDGTVQKILSAMTEKKLIADDFIAGWDGRQPKREDSGNPNTGALSSTERSRLHREKLKRDATCGDAMQRDATQSNDRGEEKRGDKEKPMSGTPDVAEGLLAYLNERAGRAFQPVESSLKLIRARLREGATEEQCRAVIDAKVGDWLNDSKMSEYLRPATLFNAEKFAGYVGQLGAKPRGDSLFGGEKYL
jgi:uncharacterized phage protein (TIGR02220 family)